MRIVGVDGSPVKNGIVSTILGVALDAAHEAGALISNLPLANFIHHPFGGKWEDSDSVEVTLAPLVAELQAADGLIFATPTWWSMPSDHMKILLSALTTLDARGYGLQGKAAACISVCEEDGAQHANMLMMNTLVHMGCAIVPFSGSFFYHKKMQGKS